jgi:excisionase family DNA binding protein
MKRYLTIKQASEILKIHPDTLRRWDRTDKIKTRRHKGNAYRVYTAGDIRKLKARIMGD